MQKDITKKGKRILACIMIVVMALTAVPLGNWAGLDIGIVSNAAGAKVVDQGNCGKVLYYDDNKPTFDNNARFTFYSDGKLVISGKGEFGGFEHPDNNYYYVPYARYELIDSKNETYADISVKSVVIEKGITDIGQCAFEDFLALESVVIPSGVKSIGYKAFWGCENLEVISIPNGVTDIGDGAFFWCADLDEIILPTSVNKIGYGVFWGCKSLTHISIPDGITNISASSFYDCTNLKTVLIPESVKAIKSNVFYGCTSLEDIFYTGTEQQFQSIVVDPKGNACINYAIVHCNHNHDYKSKVIVAPTCCTKGKAEMICACGEHYSKILPITGAYSPKVRITKATTTTDGESVTYCDNCKKVRNTVTISRVDSIKLSTTAYTYDGKTKTPTVTVKSSKGTALKNGTDYTVSYASGRKNPGQYAVKVTFKGNYSGSKTLYFNILPGVTSKITASQSTNAIKLTWTAVPKATGYKVYLYNTKTKKYTAVTTTTKNTVTLTKLQPGTDYIYAVKAYSSVNGTVYWSAGYKTITTATKPNAPSLKAVAGSKKVTLSWTKQTGADGYVIYAATSANGKYTKIANVKGTVSSFTKTGLTTGKTYYFKVAAYSTVGGKVLYSGWSSVKSAKIK